MFATLVFGCGAAACGPSFQAVYEGDVHFEHCYALDQSVSPPTSKQGCWREWLHDYTYGQSRDRVEYAAARYSELSLNPTLPGEAPASPHVTAAAPMPTSAFVPPPNVVDGHPVSEPTVSTAAALVDPPRDPPPRAPGAECASACAQRWSSCRTGCRDGVCDNCDRAYRACVPACFEDAPVRRPVQRSSR